MPEQPADRGPLRDPQAPPGTYTQARAAFDAGSKLHLDGSVYLVRRVIKQPQDGLVLWVYDQRTRGDHGWLLLPDGDVVVR